MSANVSNASASASSPLPASRPTRHESHRASMLITAGNSLLTCSVIMLLATIFIAYVIPEQVTLKVQIISHISMLIFATGLKFGYILRLTGQHRLKQIHQRQLATEKLRQKKNHYGLCNA